MCQIFVPNFNSKRHILKIPILKADKTGLKYNLVFL